MLATEGGRVRTAIVTLHVLTDAPDAALAGQWLGEKVIVSNGHIYSATVVTQTVGDTPPR